MRPVLMTTLSDSVWSWQQSLSKALKILQLGETNQSLTFSSIFHDGCLMFASLFFFRLITLTVFMTRRLIFECKPKLIFMRFFWGIIDVAFSATNWKKKKSIKAGSVFVHAKQLKTNVWNNEKYGVKKCISLRWACKDTFLPTYANIWYLYRQNQMWNIF